MLQGELVTSLQQLWGGALCPSPVQLSQPFSLRGLVPTSTFTLTILPPTPWTLLGVPQSFTLLSRRGGPLGLTFHFLQLLSLCLDPTLWAGQAVALGHFPWDPGPSALHIPPIPTDLAVHLLAEGFTPSGLFQYP